MIGIYLFSKKDPENPLETSVKNLSAMWRFLKMVKEAYDGKNDVLKGSQYPQSIYEWKTDGYYWEIYQERGNAYDLIYRTTLKVSTNHHTTLHHEYIHPDFQRIKLKNTAAAIVKSNFQNSIKVESKQSYEEAVALLNHMSEFGTLDKFFEV